MTQHSFRKTDFFPRALEETKPQEKTVIAVDGPAASGKGTFARRLAERLGYAYLDTGALYRAVALTVLESGGNPENADDAYNALLLVRPRLTQELLQSPLLRSPEVSDAASKVSAIPEVRIDLLDYQRDFAKNPPGDVGGAVLDGRDIGTVICPQADVKFFVTASVEERARRRHDELKAGDPAITYEQVLSDLQVRDQRDRLRKMAPAIPADDAYVLDTTKLSPVETLDEGVAIIRARFLEKTNI